MSLSFNGQAKTITWSGGALSVRQLWSRYVDWLAEGDNSKFGSMLYTVGMDTDDIPLYVFLDVGVTVVITNNAIVTNIYEGVLKTPDDHDPFGGAVVNVRYESPGIAIGYSTTGSTGPTADAIAEAVRLNIASELLKIVKVAELHGIGASLVVTPTSRVAGSVTQTIQRNAGVTTVSST